MIEMITNIIKDVGFPIGVTIYLLVSRERVIRNNTEVMTQVKLLMERCKR